MKKIASIILAAAVLSTLLTACGNTARDNTDTASLAVEAKLPSPSDEKHHILYFKDKSKSENVVVTFFNSDSMESEDVPMTKTQEDDSGSTFFCEGNIENYNMAHITYSDKKTRDFAFNKCVSGWYNSDEGFLPYTEGEELVYYPQYEHIELMCNGYKKNVHVWTPEDYDASSDEKYATIYALDGQAMAYIGEKGTTPKDDDNIPAQIKSMIAETGYKTILVAVDSYGDLTTQFRDDELVPNIGKLGVDDVYTQQRGNEFADFISGTLVDYIQQNYNVYIDALHTSITGESLGGLEAFYIGMEYPDKFGTVGALSPSFWNYDDAVWSEYLSKKSFDDNSAFLYLYTGGAGGDTDPYVTEMYERLKQLGYPQEKLVLHYNEWGGHHINYWRGIFSEFLEAMIFQHVEALQKE